MMWSQGLRRRGNQGRLRARDASLPRSAMTSRRASRPTTANGSQQPDARPDRGDERSTLRLSSEKQETHRALHEVALATPSGRQATCCRRVRRGARRISRRRSRAMTPASRRRSNSASARRYGADSDASYLAMTFWQLGEVERARRLTELAKTHDGRIRSPHTLAHTPYLHCAYSKCCAAMPARTAARAL